MDEVFRAGQHDGLNIYPAMVLPNAQFNDPEYRVEHGLQTRVTPLLLIHGNAEQIGPQEMYEIVVGTSSMSNQDWIEAMVFAWVVQALHCLNLTQFIARFLHIQKDMNFSDFYCKLIRVSSQEAPVLYGNLEILRNKLSEVIKGTGNLDLEDRRFGDIVWPVEEILFLRLLADGFFDEIPMLLIKKFGLEERDAKDLCKFQQFSLKSPWRQKTKESFIKDWLSLLRQKDNNSRSSAVPSEFTAKESYAYQDIREYARDVVWYGRKGSSMVREIY